MAHGCASSAWTLGFYILHNWMMALSARRQEEAFAMRPFLAPASRVASRRRRAPAPTSSITRCSGLPAASLRAR
jgi:hypothetical protein